MDDFIINGMEMIFIIFFFNVSIIATYYFFFPPKSICQDTILSLNKHIKQIEETAKRDKESFNSLRYKHDKDSIKIIALQNSVTRQSNKQSKLESENLGLQNSLKNAIDRSNRQIAKMTKGLEKLKERYVMTIVAATDEMLPPDEKIRLIKDVKTEIEDILGVNNG